MRRSYAAVYASRLIMSGIGPIVSEPESRCRASVLQLAMPMTFLTWEPSGQCDTSSWRSQLAHLALLA